MVRPYGKTPKKKTARKSGGAGEGKALIVRIKAKDDKSLSMAEFRQGLLDLHAKLKDSDDLRVKRGALYLNLIDGEGDPAALDGKMSLTINPYRSAADQYGV